MQKIWILKIILSISNIKVTKPTIVWPTNFIYTLLYLVLNQLALLEEKNLMRLRNINIVENYLQIDAFLASNGRIKKNFL